MSKQPRMECDVLVVGAGPAGIAAAVAAAECGRRVLLLDDNLRPGGQIWREGLHGRATGRSRLRAAWLQRLQACPAVVLPEMRIVARCGSDGVLAEGASGCCRIQPQSIVLATGARERFLPFPGWTLPNVMGAGGLQAMVASGTPVAGKRVVVAGSGPLLLAASAFLSQRGAHVQAICEQSSRFRLAQFSLALLRRPRLLLQGAGYRRKTLHAPYLPGWWPAAAHGGSHIETVTITNGRRRKELACDYLACGFHLVANLELPSLLGCRIEDGAVAVDAYQRSSAADLYCAGEITGIGGLQWALLTGQIAGWSAAGRRGEAERLFPKRQALQQFSAALRGAFRLRPELKHVPAETLVCRCEDIPLGSMSQYGSWRSAKIHTRCGMGPCQGRVCGTAAEFLFGWQADSVRPPIYPARLSTLAEAFSDTESITPIEEER